MLLLTFTFLLSLSPSDPGLGSYRYGHADGYDHRDRDMNTDWYNNNSPRGYYDQRSSSEWENGPHARHHDGAWSGEKYPERDFYYQQGSHFSEQPYGSSYRRGNAPSLSRGASSGNMGYNASVNDRWSGRGEGYREEYPTSAASGAGAGAGGASRSTAALNSTHSTSNNTVSAMAGTASEPRVTENQAKSAPSVSVPSAPKPPVQVSQPASSTQSGQSAQSAQSIGVSLATTNVKASVPPPVPPSRLRVDSTASIGSTSLHLSNTVPNSNAITAGSVPVELGGAMEVSSGQPIRVKRAHSDGVVADHRTHHYAHNMHNTQPTTQPSAPANLAHPAAPTSHSVRDDHVAKKAKHESTYGDSNRHRKESTPVKKPAPVVVAPEPVVPVSTTSLFDTLSKFKSSAPVLTSSVSSTQPYVSITGALSIETPSMLQNTLPAPLSGYKNIYNSAGLSTPMKPGAIAPSGATGVSIGVIGATTVTVATTGVAGAEEASSAANTVVPTSAPTTTTATATAEDNKRPRVAWGQGKINLILLYKFAQFTSVNAIRFSIY